MILFTKGTNEQSVPFKITAREQFMNIWKKNNQVSHCTWEVPRKRTVCCQYGRMMFIREDRKTVNLTEKSYS